MSVEPVALQRWAQASMPVLVDAAIKGAVLLSAAALAAAAMRKASAAARQLLWVLALGGLLALPLASAALPSWRVLPGWARLEVASAGEPSGARAADFPPPQAAGNPSSTAPDPRAVGGHVSGEGDPPARRPAAWGADAPGGGSSLTDAVARAPAAAAAADGQGTGGGRTGTGRWAILLPAALALWALGTLACLAPLVLGRASLWRLARTARRIEGGSWALLARRAAAALGLRRPVSLLQSPDEPMPLVWGLLRPRLLLPAEADNWSPQRRWVVLLHELAHARRYDCLAKFVAHVACAAYWFNPLAWLAFRLMQREAEAACDDMVLAAGNSCRRLGRTPSGIPDLRPSDYAEHLLELASGLRSGMLTAYSSIAMARKSKLEGRLLAILDGGRSRRALTRWGVLLAAAIVAGIVVPVSIMRAAGPEGADRKFRDLAPRLLAAVKAGDEGQLERLLEGRHESSGSPPRYRDLVGLLADLKGHYDLSGTGVKAIFVNDRLGPDVKIIFSPMRARDARAAALDGPDAMLVVTFVRRWGEWLGRGTWDCSAAGPSVVQWETTKERLLSSGFREVPVAAAGTPGPPGGLPAPAAEKFDLRGGYRPGCRYELVKTATVEARESRYRVYLSVASPAAPDSSGRQTLEATVTRVALGTIGAERDSDVNPPSTDRESRDPLKLKDAKVVISVDRQGRAVQSLVDAATLKNKLGSFELAKNVAGELTWLAMSAWMFMPSQPVAVGESWSPDPKLSLYNMPTNAELLQETTTCTLKEVQTTGAGRVALIRVTGRGGQTIGGDYHRPPFSGEVRYNIDTGQLIEHRYDLDVPGRDIIRMTTDLKAVAGPAAAGKSADTKPAGSGPWGAPVKGIQCRMIATKRYTVEDPDGIAMDVVYRNVGSVPITVYATSDRNYKWTRVEIRNPEGELVKVVTSGPGPTWNAKARHFRQLPPGNATQWGQPLLSPGRDTLPPGRYLVRVKIGGLAELQKHVPDFDVVCRANKIEVWAEPIESGDCELIIGGARTGPAAPTSSGTSPGDGWTPAEAALKECLSQSDGLSQKESVAAWVAFLKRNDLTDAMRFYAWWRISRRLSYNINRQKGELPDYPGAIGASKAALSAAGTLVTWETVNCATLHGSLPGAPVEQAKRWLESYRWLQTRTDAMIQASAEQVDSNLPDGGMLGLKFFPPSYSQSRRLPPEERVPYLMARLAEGRSSMERWIADWIRANRQTPGGREAVATLLSQVENVAPAKLVQQWRQTQPAGEPLQSASRPAAQANHDAAIERFRHLSIAVEPERLAALGLTAENVVFALRASGFAGGIDAGKVASLGGLTLARPDGAAVRLSDVARIAERQGEAVLPPGGLGPLTRTTPEGTEILLPITGGTSAPSTGPGPSTQPAERRVTLEGPEVTDESLGQLKGARLESLMLYQTGVTDEGLARLAEVASLKKLYLRTKGVKGHGLARLKAVSGLESLEVMGAISN